MIKQIILSLILITLLLTGCITTAQDDSQVSQADVVTETQAENDSEDQKSHGKSQ